jgi:thiol-disulfide isomerase/thioredoxin
VAPDVADDLVDGTDDGDVPDDAPQEAVRRRAPARHRLDATTLVVCIVIALLAAVLAGALVSRMIDDDAQGPGPEAVLQESEEAPSVEFERFDGSPVSLDDYRGQPLVVNFWGSWCVPCITEMPDLQRVHTSVGETVTFLGVNIRDETEDALEMISKTGVTYDLARDPDGALTRALEVTGFPTTLLIQADGTIVDRVYQRISAERLCDKINQSLAAGALTKCG